MRQIIISTLKVLTDLENYLGYSLKGEISKEHYTHLRDLYQDDALPYNCMSLAFHIVQTVKPGDVIEFNII